MDTHAAAGEHRLGACIADPGGWGTAPNLRRFAITFAVSTNDDTALGVAGQVAFDWMQAGVDGSLRLRWSSVQRGDWVHRVKELRGYVWAVQPFTLEGQVESITFPSWRTRAENDTLAAGTATLFDALTCPKAVTKFLASTGGCEHCEP